LGYCAVFNPHRVRYQLLIAAAADCDDRDEVIAVVSLKVAE
jgi:hypothetical protein